MSAGIVIAVAALLVAWLVAGATVVRLSARYWLRSWAERGLRGVVSPLGAPSRPQRLLTAATLAAAFVMAAAGALLTAIAGHDAERLAWNLGMCALIILFVAQILARAIARHSSAEIAGWAIPGLRFAEGLARPVLLAAAGFRRLWPGGGAAAMDERTMVERVLREAELEGIGAREDAAIITGVAEFGDMRARDVMTARRDVFAVSDQLPPADAAAQVARQAYSRVPVYHQSLDNVVGMIHAFDLLRGVDETLQHLRPVASVADDAPCSEVLFRMLRDHRHLAVVQDRSRHTVGILTLEDLLEQLVGDIRDEHDEPSAPTA